ncbi:MAG TPA: DUF6491 family protein [Caulobacter sp.]|nr:DUF6491 family protein [Caulobacter sp.]
MKRLILAAALGSAALIAGASVTTAAAGDKQNQQAKKTDCFFNRQVHNYTTADDDRTLYVRAGKNTYRMETFGRCIDLSSALNIGLDSHPSSSICSAQDVTIVVGSSSMGPQRCAVRTLTKLTAAEVAALPKGDRP